MKILVVEDDLKNIESAMIQLKDHQVTYIRSWIQLMDLRTNDFQDYDLILTDLNVKFGKRDEVCFSVEKKYAETDLVPLGLLVIIKAANFGIPCILVTDSNGHNDALGCLMENWGGANCLTISNDWEKKLAYFISRPQWIETSLGQGKDWLNAIKISPWGNLL